MKRIAGRRSPATLTLATVAVTAAAVLTSGGGALAGETLETTELPAGRYIVQVAGEPVASYDGGVSGFSATQPDDGEKIDDGSGAVVRYRDYLAGLRGEVIGEVPGIAPVRQFDTVLNGFTADLSAEQAERLSREPGVLGLWPDAEVHLDTSNTPGFLGLAGDGGVWEEQYGGDEHAGEGVIVGVLDSGFWPETPSFGPLPEPRPDQDVIDAKWSGECMTGEGAGAVTCNNKVIGARYYPDGAAILPTDYLSPRDHHGHGSHTSSTAAGNHGVDAGPVFGSLSGMAPAARLAIYKICWRNTTGGCPARTTNVVSAIEDSVNDGVDVINYSFGSTGDITAFDPIHLAYFNAAAAGVFVATSAGNSGPAASTVGHNTPWMTTVAASTYDKAYLAKVTLGNGTTVTGAGIGTALPSTAVISSEAAAKAGVPANQAKECWAGSLDPAKAAGKIVTCARGTVARVEKSQTVKNAGGVGMIQYNVLATDNTVADNHIIPSVHISAADGATVLAYVNGTAAPTAAFTAGTATPAKAPQMASFSSAGPSLQAGGDLLKPDITAPGVDIFAATSPDTNNGGLYAPNSGTSMASPHIAGIAALIRGKHPDWSPTAVRSALMTSASQTDNEGDAIQRGGVDATSFDYGSGHVTPGGAFDPGLVYESGPIDWLRFGCGTGELISIGYGDLCDEYGPIDPSDLNYPSIAVGSLVGKQTITRTVTNVDDSTSTYFVKTSAPAGTKVDVSPKTLTVKPGKTATYTVTITRTNAAYGSYTHGSITWKDFNGHSVRSPIAVRPAQIAAVSEVDGTGVSGSVGLGGTVGYAGTLKATVSGIVPAAVSPLALSNPTGGTFPTAAPVENDHVKKVEVTVPSGSGAKFAVYGADYTADTDVDLYFYRKSATGALTYLGASASGGSDESAVLPGGATYVVYVDLWSSPGSAPVTVGFHSFVYGADTGALKLSPASQTVTTGQKFVVTASWSGLTAGTRYFGVVSYRDASNTALTSTAVTITT